MTGAEGEAEGTGKTEGAGGDEGAGAADGAADGVGVLAPLGPLGLLGLLGRLGRLGRLGVGVDALPPLAWEVTPPACEVSRRPGPASFGSRSIVPTFRRSGLAPTSCRFSL